MTKILIYGGVEYPNFTIDEDGNVTNLATGKVLARSVFKDGYYHTTLPMGKRGVVKSIRNHKAVAETFVPNPNGYSVVHHIDGNKLHCNASNLMWTTSTANTRLHLLEQSKHIEIFNNRKLTYDDVQRIIDLASTHSRRQLADMFDVSKTTITNVCNHRYYKT